MHAGKSTELSELTAVVHSTHPSKLKDVHRLEQKMFGNKNSYVNLNLNLKDF